MDHKIRELFEDTANLDLTGIIISNSTDKDKISKIKIRPVIIKEEIYFQASEYIGVKIFHTNYKKEELFEKLPDWFDGLFRQAEIMTGNGNAVLMISKKGKVTINDKISKASETKTLKEDTPGLSVSRREGLQHNRIKNYILMEGKPLPFLVDLGVMSPEGLVIKAKSDKFRQINRFLEYIEDILTYLASDRELTILDFGCGKSYLTFAMYYYLKILKGYDINIIGLDLKSEVIKECNRLSRKYGYEKLQFLEGDIASYTGRSCVDMVVTLHACDTATDYALYKAVNWGAKVILSVPCCQHELNKQLQCEILKPVMKYGIIRERTAALLTDAFRAQILETKGYHVQLLEFIDMEHTPKNILIRAVMNDPDNHTDEKTDGGLMECMSFLNVSPCLYRLFEEEKENGKEPL